MFALAVLLLLVFACGAGVGSLLTIQAMKDY